MIKNSVLEGFSGDVTAAQVLISLLIAFAAGLFILLIYRLTFNGTTLNRGFMFSLIMASMISAMIVMTITSNLALSLGMVGALSIIRFRTAIKDPMDTMFLFWAVAVGITAGASFYLLCVLATVIIGAIFYGMSFFAGKTSSAYLLVVRSGSADAVRSVESTLKHYNVKHKMSSKVRTPRYIEAVYEVRIGKDDKNLVDTLSEIPNIGEVSMVDCRNSAV